MKLQEAMDRIAELEKDLEAARAANAGTMNPVYTELLAHLIDGPKSISELAGLMTRENRTISQYLHALKVRYGADITTLNDGRKQLMNAQIFQTAVPEEVQPS